MTLYAQYGDSRYPYSWVNPDEYYLFDQFYTDRTAGAVNGTSADGVGGARTVVDTNSKITISGGLLSFATGGAVNDGIRYPAQSRTAGKVFTGTINLSAFGAFLGFDANTSGGLSDYLWLRSDNSTLYITSTTIANVIVGTISATSYQVAVIQRDNGNHYFIKGGAFTNWTLVFNTTAGNAATMYPSLTISSASSVLTADNLRITTDIYNPVPLQSDGFSATTTDGAGTAEANGPTGTAYTAVGTWGVSVGSLSCSALSGGLGFRYLDGVSADVLLDLAVTRSAGNAGIVARYVDANNYLIAYHDGTNAKLDRVVAGVTTNLVSAAATYGAGRVLRLILDGTSARLFYNNAAVGSVATVPSSTSTNHGAYTTNTGNTFDNFVVWARGTSGEYAALDNL